MITTTAIDEAVLNIVADGQLEVPQLNAFNGVDLWKPGQLGLVYNRRTASYYMKEGVRVAEDDGVVHVYRFEPTGVAQHVTITNPTAAQLEALIRVMF